MHEGKFTGPFDGFSTPDWDYIREQATKKALAIRSQGFIHPATLVPDELEYAEGYKARMSKLKEKVICSQNAYKQPPSKIGLPLGGSMSVQLALESILVKSANDVAIMLAEKISGSEEEFVKLMMDETS